MSTITIKELSKSFGNVEVLKPFTDTFKDDHGADHHLFADRRH